MQFSFMVCGRFSSKFWIHGAVRFPSRAESVGVRESSCVSRFRMFLPIVYLNVLGDS